MKQSNRTYCIPGDRFPANFILSAFADTNAELPSDAPNAIIVIPDEQGNLPKQFTAAMIDLSPRQAYLLSSATVYGDEYTDADEDTPTASTPAALAWLHAESDFKSQCERHNTTATILRLPLLIGTGMTGEIRRRVNAIHRGVYRHIEGIEAHQSVLHARDLPDLIIALTGQPGVYNVSDRTDPTTYEIAEALSARMGAKRIYTVKAKWAQLAARFADIFGIKDLGSAYLKSVTATRTISPARLTANCPTYSPTNTTTFLRSHTYSPLDP